MDEATPPLFLLPTQKLPFLHSESLLPSNASIICSQGKVALHAITNFKELLEEVVEYHHHPLPAICSQAVNVTCWFYLFMGAFASQPCDHCKYVKDIFKCPKRDSAGDFWYLFQVKTNLFFFLSFDLEYNLFHGKCSQHYTSK